MNKIEVIDPELEPSRDPTVMRMPPDSARKAPSQFEPKRIKLNGILLHEDAHLQVNNLGPLLEVEIDGIDMTPAEVWIYGVLRAKSVVHTCPRCLQERQ